MNIKRLVQEEVRKQLGLVEERSNIDKLFRVSGEIVIVDEKEMVLYFSAHGFDIERIELGGEYDIWIEFYSRNSIANPHDLGNIEKELEQNRLVWSAYRAKEHLFNIEFKELKPKIY